MDPRLRGNDNNMKFPKIKRRDVGIILIAVPSMLFLAAMYDFLLTTIIIWLHTIEGVDMSFLYTNISVQEGLTRLLSHRLNSMIILRYLLIVASIGLVIGGVLIKTAAASQTVLSSKKFIKKAAQVMRSHLGLFAKFILVIFATKVCSEILQYTFAETMMIQNIIAVSEFLVFSYFQIGMIVVSLAIVHNKQPKFKDFFVGHYLFLKFLLAAMLFMIMVRIGLELYVIPGLYLGFRYMFFPYFLASKKELDIMGAFRLSAKATEGAKMDIFLLQYILLLLLIVAMATLGLGLFIVVPLASIVWALVYKSRV